MAINQDQKQVFVLVRGAISEVVLVDTSSGKVREQRPLANDLIYRGLDIGPVSGRIYVFANREVGPDRGPSKGPPSDAVITVLSPDLSTVVLSKTVRTSAGFDWFVYRGGLDASETHILLSYHGPDTTGVDRIAIEGDRLINPCTQPQYGCIRSHGGFLVTADRDYFATGSSEILETDQTGQTIRQIDTGILNEHLMEMAFGPNQSNIFIAGSCLYSRGLFELDLGSLRTTTLVKQSSDICGERVLVTSLLVVIDPDVLFVNPKTGSEERRIKIADDVAVDGLAIP